MASESTGWPLLDERPALPRRAEQTSHRRRARSGWLLAVLAFLCGGLVSAAGFSIGWRHQAQQGNQAQAALASATARNHALQASLAAARAATTRARQAEKRARLGKAAAQASASTLASAAAKVAHGATASRGAAGTVSSDAGALTSSVTRLASELKTFTTYLTTTPTRQLDPGYIQSQTAYLTRQLSALESAGGTLGGAVTSFDAAARKLAQQAAALSTQH
jgi:hypothetical protein